jgi:hypothetical protein
MKNMHRRLIAFLCLLFLWGFLFSGRLNALEADFSGQVSGWTIQVKNQETWRNFTGVRYIPQLDLNQPLKQGRSVDAEIAFNGVVAKDSKASVLWRDLEVYRATLRYASEQTETRIGLQNISFGPARLLRPLKWFDQLDPTDPLQLTKGVYALRFTYSAMNNAGLWIWGLYGNDEPKGYEVLPTATNQPEIGGRLQYPVLDGEMAATVHSRKVGGVTLGIPEYEEYRFGLDGQWDIGIGVWFETAFQYQDVPVLPYDWTKMGTLGLDYTFGVGSGLYVLFEHMTSVLSSDLSGWDEKSHVSSFLLNYPLGFIDNLMAIGYYTWDQKKYGQYLNWQRTYDWVVFSTGLFYYPEVDGNNTVDNQLISMGGYGGEFTLIFNY